MRGLGRGYGSVASILGASGCNNILRISRRIFHATANSEKPMLSSELTPNPNARMFFGNNLQFLPDALENNLSFGRQQKSFSKGYQSELAENLLKVEGIFSVLLSKEFLTVVKEREADWHLLEPIIKTEIFRLLDIGAAFVHRQDATPSNKDDSPEAEKLSEANNESDIYESIKLLIETRVRPMVQDDGGDVEVIKFDANTGIVWVHMKGACEGCPSALYTVQQSMSAMLRHFIPEVNGVSQCDENGEPLIEEESFDGS